jgi:hypothetical protein
MSPIVDGGTASTIFNQGVATTQVFQSSFNGLVWGPGTDIQLVKTTGLRGLPGVRGGDEAYPRQHGSLAGLDFLDERIFVTTLQVFAPTAPYETVLTAIAAAFQIITDPAKQLPYQVQLPGWAEPRQITCRPTAGGYPIDTEYQFGKAVIAVEFTAADPLLYSSTLHTASSGLPSPTAGLPFPVTFPVTFGASTGGSMSVTNLGNFATAPVITIVGPVTNPRVTLTNTGAFMACTITLGSTDALVIDMAAGTITLNGTADRYNTIVTGSSWWAIPPGVSSIGVASTDSAQVAAIFTTTWRDAWGWA